MSYKDTIKSYLTTISPSLFSISQSIHSNPELGWKEHYASSLLVKFLKEEGFEVTYPLYDIPTAFRAEFSLKKGKGVTIGFCSEYDALPKIGHACGHNLIAIQSLLSALSLVQLIKLNNWEHKIVVYGTPAEEVEGGKINIINNGGFKECDICLMLHPGNLNIAHPRYLALQAVTVKYYGKAAHGSIPFDGINALDAIVQAYNGIAMLRQHIPSTSRIHGIITNGGMAPNVIPDYTEGKFYIRSKLHSQNINLIKRVENIFNGAAMITGCRVELEYEDGFKDVNNNYHLSQRWQDYMSSEGISFLSKLEQEMIPRGSTDMGNVSYVIPSFHNIVDLYPPSTKEKAEIHTEGFREQAKTKEAFDSMLQGSICQSLVALDCMLDSEFLNIVKKEFEESLSR